ncbi:acyl carrier protein [Amycolatopsis sp. NPDC051106]|jgi:acyl carrier protein|uniref:acyl carrier protein n=1 Tax=unclassified Amycolatopsis TaxID=2618356 RepID=UPI0034392E31
MSPKTSLENTLREILVADLYVDVPADGIHAEDSLQETLGLDSLGFIELRARCEQQFGVAISDTDFTPVNFRSISTIADFVVRRQAGN